MQDRFTFRVWDKRHKEYAYDVQNEFQKYGHMICETLDFGQVLNDDELELEQCTGLKDKNGKLIYEGDIINYGLSGKVNTVENFAQKIFQGKYVVEFCEYYFSPFNHVNTKAVEVIGNIHENPELLEDNK